MPHLKCQDSFPFESFLSFLGLGTQEPMSSCAPLSDGAAQMEVSPAINFPGIFPFYLTLFCFNLYR